MHLTRRLVSSEALDRFSSSDATGAQAQFRVDCLETTKTFLDRFTERTTGHYGQVPLVEWTQLLFAFSTLAYINSHFPSPHYRADAFHAFDTWRRILNSKFPPPAEDQGKGEDMCARFRRVTDAMLFEMRAPAASATSPSNSSFAITSSSRQAVSILHPDDASPSLPPLQLSGTAKNSTSLVSLPSIMKRTKSLNMESEGFTWKFLTGDI